MSASSSTRLAIIAFAVTTITRITFSVALANVPQDLTAGYMGNLRIEYANIWRKLV